MISNKGQVGIILIVIAVAGVLGTGGYFLLKKTPTEYYIGEPIGPLQSKVCERMGYIGDATESVSWECDPRLYEKCELYYKQQVYREHTCLEYFRGSCIRWSTPSTWELKEKPLNEYTYTGIQNDVSIQKVDICTYPEKCENSHLYKSSSDYKCNSWVLWGIATGDKCGNGVKEANEECDYNDANSKYTTSGCGVNERKVCGKECFYGSCQCIGDKKRCSDRQPQKCSNGQWVNDGSVCQYGCYGEGSCNECEANTKFCEGSYVVTCVGSSTLGWKKQSQLCSNGCSGGACNPSPSCPTSCPDDGNLCTREFCNKNTFKCDKENLDGPQEGWSGYAVDNPCRKKVCKNGVESYEDVIYRYITNTSGCVDGKLKTCPNCDRTERWNLCVNKLQTGTKQECNITTYTCEQVSIGPRYCECNNGEYRCNPLNDRLIEECVDYRWSEIKTCVSDEVCKE